MIVNKAFGSPLKSSDYYIQLFDQLPSLMWRSGLDTQCNWFNPKWLEFTGRTLQEEVGNGWTEGIHPDDFDMCLKIYLENFNARKPFEMDYRLKHYSGEYRWIHDIGQPFSDDNEEFAGFLGTCYDIHEGKEAQLRINNLIVELEEKVKVRTSELEKTEERFKTVINAAPLIIWSLDKNGVFTLSEGKGLEGLGIKPGELVGKCHFDLYKDFPEATKKIKRALHGETLYEEVEVLGRSFYTYYTPLKNDDDTIEGIVSVSTEITDRKKIEWNLLESEERLKLALQSAVLGIWDFNPVTGELKWDTRCKEIFGIPPDTNVDYELFLSRIHPEDRERTNATVQNAFNPESGGEYTIEYRVIGLMDKLERWVLAKGKAIFNENKQAVRFIGTIFDITANKQSEIALKHSEENFRNVANSVPVKIWITDSTGYCNYLNQQWYDYTGQEKDEAIGMGWLKVVHPEDYKATEQIFIDANTKKIPFQQTYRLRDKHGNYRWFFDYGQPKVNEQGEYEGYIGAVIDIHDRVVAEQNIINKNEQLIKINTDLDNFIYTASHDLKAPISNIEGLISSLPDSISDESRQSVEYNEIMVLIQKSIDRFKNTIQDLTDISRVQKNITEEESDIDICEIVDDVKVSLDSEIKNTQAVIKTDLNSCPKILYSKRNFKSIIYNLLNNAIKYRSADRQPLINLCIVKTEEFIILSVEDNGLGIPPTKINQIFGMFKRLHDHVEGTGVGLYIVKRIVENNGGKIEVDSEQGKGTIFKIYFRS